MYQLSIRQFPSGNWGYVGSLPLILTKTTQDPYGKDLQTSLIFNSKQEAKAYATSKGISL